VEISQCPRFLFPLRDLNFLVDFEVEPAGRRIEVWTAAEGGGREGGKDACARRRHPDDVPRIDAIPVLGIGVVAERSECTALYWRRQIDNPAASAACHPGISRPSGQSCSCSKNSDICFRLITIWFLLCFCDYSVRIPNSESCFRLSVITLFFFPPVY
jgi:hypothetical protein